ncbi:MAG: DNA primase [Acetobacteraceae bacterium]
MTQLPPSFLEEVRARTPLAELIGGRVRLSRSGRQWKGCCPFHDEKTPSFQVYDDHFHCYGCGAHGDAISFVMQSQGLGFMEAVTELASRAGLAVPKPSAEAAEAETARQDAFSVLEAAARAFARRLFLPEGRAALAYLRGRGLGDQTIRDFGLGWSGEGRGTLLAELGREGFSTPRLAAAGLLKEHENSSYSEFFFNRVMFPIRDARGRAVSFGARALGEGQPKYLNGPETEIFAKRRLIYGLDRARPSFKAGPPIVVEGYMDVIQMHQAGFAAAVAPLGTALTEEQLQTLWRFAEAPVICFDGDAAGARAAERVIDLALPLLAPGRTLGFAALPEGEDPDSLLRRGGLEAFRAAIAAPEPLFRALFRLVRASTGEATPEQRALFRARLEAASARIADRGLAGEYRRTLRELSFTPANRRTGGKQIRPPPGALVTDRPRQLIAILLRQPALIPEVEEGLSGFPLSPALDRLRDAILQCPEEVPPLDSPGLIAHLNAAGLAEELREALASLPLPVCPADVDPAEARARWREVYDMLVTEPRLTEDVAARQRDFAAMMAPALERRLAASKFELDSVRRGAEEKARE